MRAFRVGVICREIDRIVIHNLAHHHHRNTYPTEFEFALARVRHLAQPAGHVPEADVDAFWVLQHKVKLVTACLEVGHQVAEEIWLVK